MQKTESGNSSDGGSTLFLREITVEESGQTDAEWREGRSNSINHLLQRWWAENLQEQAT